MNIGYRLESGRLAALKSKVTANLYPWLKRALDIAVAGLALICLLPIILLTVLLIRLESPGPSFFKQTRVGNRGQHFLMWKFRSMKVVSDSEKKRLAQKAGLSDGVRFKMEKDPRITTVGHVIRKFSIDELPQLFNVLKGNMSLVGPRPALPEEVAKYTPWQTLRLNAKPGITCTWQVSGRSTIPFLQQVEMDIDYIRRANLWLDFKLLLRTIPAVILGRGAY